MRPRRIEKEPLARRVKAREGDSAAHLRFVRGLPDVAAIAMGGDVCELPAGGEAHHLQGHAVGHALGRRVEDRWTIPVSRITHHWLHVPTPHRPEDGPANPHDRLAMLGFDPITLADLLWRHTGDDDAARRALYRVAWNKATLEARHILSRMDGETMR